MRILRASAYRRMAWKNGGGTTTEVAIAPEGAALDAFDWRLSMAHVATPGPFSIFPGIDRSLAVIAGAGVTLHLGGRGDVRLGPDSPPFAFPADLPVEASLVDGAIDDLNVMTRRGSWRHLLSRLRLGAPTKLPRHGDVLVVLARQHGATLRAGTHRGALAPGDAVVIDDDAALDLVPDGDDVYFAIDLWRSA